MGPDDAALALTGRKVHPAAPGAGDLESAGLYDPHAADAPARLALLEYLIALGATVEEMAATPPDELPGLASTLALWAGSERLTIDEVAARAGVDRALIVRVWRAAGFPEPSRDGDNRAFSTRDVELIEIFRAGSEFLGEEVTLQMLRVIGAAAARVADASVSAFMVNIAPQALVQDPSGLALARANTDSMALVGSMTDGFDTLLRHHIERGYRPLNVIASATDVDLVLRSVGFADLVDSTSWTQQLDLSALARALSEFDAVASEIVVERGGRVVKLIGDEVMFVANTAGAAADIALALIEAFAAHDALPPVRAGIASGEVLTRDGDFSGAVVNLAARAVKMAAPSTLLVDGATRDALEGDAAYAFGAAAEQTLKGFAEPVRLTRVMRTR